MYDRYGLTNNLKRSIHTPAVPSMMDMDSLTTSEIKSHSSRMVHIIESFFVFVSASANFIVSIMKQVP